MLNLPFHSAVNALRLILLQLERDGIEVISFKSKDKTVIEVKPDPRLLATGQKGNYGYYEDQGILVIWRTI